MKESGTELKWSGNKDSVIFILPYCLLVNDSSNYIPAVPCMLFFQLPESLMDRLIRCLKWYNCNNDAGLHVVPGYQSYLLLVKCCIVINSRLLRNRST